MCSINAINPMVLLMARVVITGRSSEVANVF